jgi:restriction endonuclease S subunit
MAGELRDAVLSDLVAIQRGHDLTESERRPGRVPVLGSAGQNGFHDTALAPGPGVVIGRSGASFGQVSYCEVAYWPHNTVLYVTDFRGNNPRFVYYCLKAMDFSLYNSGSAQQSLNRNYIYSAPLRIPDAQTQRAIAHILGTLDDKIELNRRMSETLEAMARALFKSWFVDFEPVRAKAEGRDPGLPKPVADLFSARLVDSEQGEIPEGWEVRMVGQYMANHDSKRVPVSGSERAKRRGPYPYHGAAGVMDYVDDYLFDGIYLLVGEDGSVVRESGLGVTQYVWGKLWVNNHAHVLQGKGAVSTEQLYLYFQFEPVAPYVTGAVQPKLSQGRMNAMPFVCAGEKVCHTFRELVDPWFAKLRICAEESRTLHALRDALLPRLISSELRVKDASKFIGGTA